MIAAPTPALRAYAWAVVILVTGGIVASLVYVSVYGDGHEPATPQGARMLVTVCPSAEHYRPELEDARLDYLESTDCRPAALRVDTCDGGPAVGEVQVRDCADILDGYPGGCPEGYLDRVGMRAGAGVAYMSSGASPHHVIGHAALQLDHTTAATSWMHGCDYSTDERCRAGHLPSYIRCQDE